MPYYKQREDCKNKSGKKGTFVTVNKSTGERKCWKSERAYKNAAPSIYTNEVDDITSGSIEESWKLIREYVREILLENQLSNDLGVADSPIHGIGIFARNPIPAHTDLGIAQIKRSDNGYDIARLGKYHNHSNSPTCYNKDIDGAHHLFPHHDLGIGDEVTIDYTLQPDLEQPKEGWV